MLGGIYSFLMATVLVAMDAVDVAMTEASVGAGISTVLFLGALHLCKSEEARPVNKPWLPLIVSVAVPVQRFRAVLTQLKTVETGAALEDLVPSRAETGPAQPLREIDRVEAGKPAL